jgi:transcriptional regulator with XRE-family HTH domain
VITRFTSEACNSKKGINVTIGESVRIIRELQCMSQNDLSKASGAPQSTISAIENNRINLEVGVLRFMEVGQ